MWLHSATRRNHATLHADGIHFIGPGSGEMAESGEAGTGRMAEPLEIVASIEALLQPAERPLNGKTALVTSGPTHEPIDPVRYIANRSSGKQGHAIARALAALGAEVTLVSGPVTLADPQGVKTVHVETAAQMLEATLAALPVDIAVMVAAVADWRVEGEAHTKIKKEAGKAPAPLKLVENPDILKTLGHHPDRPGFLVGFAAETHDVLANARAKLARKGADVIVANDVSHSEGTKAGVMGGDRNQITLVTADGADVWPEMDKRDVADALAKWISEKIT
jgi:phosphopantothenoylcysteine decarboxylase / phosphopantothenate---cysteine ligase